MMGSGVACGWSFMATGAIHRLDGGFTIMRRRLGILAVLAALPALTALAGPAGAAPPGGAGVEATLVRCADVAFPAPLAGCGTDPLAGGSIEVNKKGGVEVSFSGAAAGESYDIVLHAPDLGSPLAIGVVTTDGLGNGSLELSSVFGANQTGVVAFTLDRAGAVQFVAGFRGVGELEAGLVRCAAVNTPAPLANCGTDTLDRGRAEIEGGNLEVELSGMPGLTYAVVLRPLGGGADVPLGDLSTNQKGKGSLEVNGLVGFAVAGAGNVVLQRDGFDQFITGFMSMQKRQPIVAKFQVGLLRCADVNTLAPMTDCGFDQLKKGDVRIFEKGDVDVHLFGAVPGATYEVFFVGFDGLTEVLVGALTTNPAGNGHTIVRDFFPVGTFGVGNVIVKRGGVDQFVTGFVVMH
jgi:hypothetical protein